MSLAPLTPPTGNDLPDAGVGALAVPSDQTAPVAPAARRRGRWRSLTARLPLPTVRLLGLLLVGAVLLGAASFSAILVVPAVAYTVVVLALAVLDNARTPGLQSMGVSRGVEDRLALGGENPVAVEIVNKSRYALRVVVRDEPPDDFRLLRVGELEQYARVGPAGRTVLATLDLPPLGRSVLRYDVMPVRRGAYAFGDVTLRYPTLLGLLERQHTYLLARNVKVYPNLREVKRYDLALRWGQLEMVGLRRTRQLGSGTEFERLRDYHPDDDYRRINWAATARRHRPVTIDYQIERAQSVLLMLDVGRLMSAPIDALTKLDHGVNSCLLAAYVCLARGDNVGLLAFADRVTLYLPPKGGTGQFNAMLESLYNVQARPAESDYRAGFAYAEQRLRRRGLVIAFTEIVDEEASRVLVSMLVRMANRHVAVCATMRDPIIDATLALPPTGSDQVYQRAVALTLAARRRATLDALGARGVIPIDVSADRLTPAVINAYLEVRARGRI